MSGKTYFDVVSPSQEVFNAYNWEEKFFTFMHKRLNAFNISIVFRDTDYNIYLTGIKGFAKLF